MVRLLLSSLTSDVFFADDVLTPTRSANSLVSVSAGCGSTDFVYNGVTNNAGVAGSVRLLYGAGENRATLRRCSFAFTKDPVISNVRCYYNSLTGVFASDISGNQCSTDPAPRTA